MKSKLQSVISGFLGILCTVPISLSYSQEVQAQYDNGDFATRITLHNQSRRSSIIGLYVWNRERQDWSRNRLYSPLEPGSDSRVMLSRQSDGCNFRIKVVYSYTRDLRTNDNDDFTLNRESTTRFNACEYRHLVIRRGELFPTRRYPGD